MREGRKEREKERDERRDRQTDIYGVKERGRRKRE